MATSSAEPGADRVAAQVGPAPEESAAWELFEQARWGGHPQVCPHCGCEGRTYLLQPSGGVRRTRTGAATARRVWKCGACRRQFSVLTGSILEGTRIALATWVVAIEHRVAGRSELPADFARAPVRRHIERLLTQVCTELAVTGSQAADRTW